MSWFVFFECKTIFQKSIPYKKKSPVRDNWTKCIDKEIKHDIFELRMTLLGPAVFTLPTVVGN